MIDDHRVTGDDDLAAAGTQRAAQLEHREVEIVGVGQSRPPPRRPRGRTSRHAAVAPATAVDPGSGTAAVPAPSARKTGASSGDRDGEPAGADPTVVRCGAHAGSATGARPAARRRLSCPRPRRRGARANRARAQCWSRAGSRAARRACAAAARAAAAVVRSPVSGRATTTSTFGPCTAADSTVDCPRPSAIDAASAAISTIDTDRCNGSAGASSAAAATRRSQSAARAGAPPAGPGCECDPFVRVVAARRRGGGHPVGARRRRTNAAASGRCAAVPTSRRPPLLPCAHRSSTSPSTKSRSRSPGGAVESARGRHVSTGPCRGNGM